MSSKLRSVIRTVSRAPIRLIRDPLSARFVHQWLPSLLSQRTALEDHSIWVSYKARKWLESYLKPDMSVLEFGSGGSTLFFAKRVKKLVSVEHDKLWYGRVSDELEKNGFSNCHFVLRELEESAEHGHLCTSTRSGYEACGFDRYVNTIDEYPDASFDLVLVDGRARMSCLSRAVGKVRPGGRLVLDDSDRPEYAEAESLLASYPRRVFRGLMPYRYRYSHTSAWEIGDRPDA